MRVIFAIVSLIISVVLIGYGLAQRTVLAEPDTLTVTSTASADAPVTVISGETLNALEGRQDLTITGTGAIFAAYARTTDIEGWIGDATRNDVGFDPDTRSIDTTVTEGSEATLPNPAGSDLWLREYTGENSLDMRVSLDADLSILLASDGTAPVPSTVTISWPVDNSTPWVGPLITGGAFFLLVSLVLFVLALVHQQRGRGPRRKSITQGKQPRMPRLPRQRTYRVSKPKEITARGRRSTQRFVVFVPIVLTGTIVLSGCSSELWPELGDLTPSASASPTPSETIVGEELRPPVATTNQIERIVADAISVQVAADASLDVEALSQRFVGPALDMRTGNYAIRAKDSAFPAPAAIPSQAVTVSLPEQSDTWPRSIFAVAQNPDDPTIPAVALVLVQSAPREKYKVDYAVTLEPNAVLPSLAPAGVGAPRLPPDTKLLTLPPNQLVPTYVDVLTNGSASTFYGAFDIEKDLLIPTSGADDRAARRAAVQNATLDSAVAVSDAEIFALGTDDAGAIVSGYMTETETLTPSAEFILSPQGAVKTLSGVTTTTRGVTYSYGDQVLFYIPPIGSTEKTVLLGYSQGLISASELP